MQTARQFLLTPVGSAGDNLPFVGLGVELARLGHAVTIAANDHFLPLIQSAGLKFLSTSTEDEYRQQINNPALFHPTRGFAAVMKSLGTLNQRLMDVVAQFRQRHGAAAAVVAGSLDMATRALSEKHAWPHVSVHLQPAMLRTNHQMPTIGRFNLSFLPQSIKKLGWRLVDKAMLDRYAGPIANSLRTQLGLPPVRRIFDQYLHSTLLGIGLWPDWYGPMQPDYPAALQLTDFPLFDAPGDPPIPEEVQAFLDQGPPPIVFTPGSAMVHGQKFFKAAADACARLGRRGLLLTAHPEQLPPALPDGVRHWPFVPLSRLLGRAAAIVHHGGVGTTSAALAAGIPQVIVPFSHDQPDNAYRVRKLGAGDRLMPGRLSARRLARALDALLNSPATQAACRQCAQRLAPRDGLLRAANLIQSAFRRSTTTAPHC